MGTMEKNEITWDGTNTAEVVDFCIRYSQCPLCSFLDFSKSGKTISNCILMRDGSFHDYDHNKIEIPSDFDMLCIEASDTMRGSDFFIKIGQTVESYKNKQGFFSIRIKKEPPDA